MISYEEGFRHVSKLLRVGVCKMGWRGHLVSDDVIHERGTTGARIAQPHHLHRCWPKCKDLVTCALCVPIHVYQDVDPITMDTISSLPIAWYLGKVNEMLCLFGNLSAKTCAIIWAQRVAENLVKNKSITSDECKLEPTKKV